MLKRPLNQQFRELVLRDKKITTIRDNPWPVRVPIMLFHWSGKAYRSKQSDIAVVVVEAVRPIKITHREDGGMLYAYGYMADEDHYLYRTEGFASQRAMDEWFKVLVKSGETVEKTLIHFRRVKEATP